MKLNKPSLILFFMALLCTIILDWAQQDLLATYSKSVVLPAIFIYFLISSEFRISITEGLIFLFCFIGQVYILMDIESSEIAGVVCFLIVYSLLIAIFLKEHDGIKLKRRDVLPVSIVIISLAYLLISVLSLELENMKKFNFLFTFYGIVLSVLSYFAFVSYITKGTYVSLLMSLMTISYIFSDIFYIFNQYFSYPVVLVLIRDTTQILAYFFMVQYFLEKARIQKRATQQ
ncbi:lysoplasmalogenase family protein [Flavobacterium olei]|uniref:lysoplasmalogenase family protein n=1 Tax=Flavobacterium olei TaxID=1886782 RepID=UPI00321A4E2C